MRSLAYGANDLEQEHCASQPETNETCHLNTEKGSKRRGELAIRCDGVGRPPRNLPDSEAGGDGLVRRAGAAQLLPEAGIPFTEKVCKATIVERAGYEGAERPDEKEK